MSGRTMTRYEPGVNGGICALSDRVYDAPAASEPAAKLTRPSGTSPMSQRASVERYAVSVQVPTAGSVLWLVTVQVTTSGSPTREAAGTVMLLTTRSAGGGSLMTMGTVEARSLLF